MNHAPEWYWERWVETLEHGDFEHCRHSFYKQDSNMRCAFGVLHEVVMADLSISREEFYKDLASYGYSRMSEILGLTPGEYDRLFTTVTDVNDDEETQDYRPVITVLERYRK